MELTAKDTPTTARITCTYRFVAQMDNHEPNRREVYGTVEVWTWPDTGEESYRVPGGVSLFMHKGPRAILLLDDGLTVRPMYTSGWSGARDVLFVAPVPVNVHPDGTPKLRADRPEPVDYATWMMGPTMAYHLKIKGV